MSTSVTDAVEQWHDFYVMTGGASAALVGLLFTTMALRANLVEESDPAFEHDLWAAASVPLACFLDILLLSLVFLVPKQSALGTAIPVFALAVLSGGQVYWVAARHWVLSAARVKRSLMPTAICYAVQAAAAVTLATGNTGLLWLLAVVIGCLVLNAAIAAWELLREPILHRATARSRQAMASNGDETDNSATEPANTKGMPAHDERSGHRPTSDD